VQPASCIMVCTITDTVNQSYRLLNGRCHDG